MKVYKKFFKSYKRYFKVYKKFLKFYKRFLKVYKRFLKVYKRFFLVYKRFLKFYKRFFKVYKRFLKVYKKSIKGFSCDDRHKFWTFLEPCIELHMLPYWAAHAQKVRFQRGLKRKPPRGQWLSDLLGRSWWDFVQSLKKAPCARTAIFIQCCSVKESDLSFCFEKTLSTVKVSWKI